MNQIYLDTVRLLTQVAPIVFADGVFALKGGMAILVSIGRICLCEKSRPRRDWGWSLAVAAIATAATEKVKRIG